MQQRQLPIVGRSGGGRWGGRWGRWLSEAPSRRGAGAEVVMEALGLAEDERTPANLPARAAPQPVGIPAPLQ